MVQWGTEKDKTQEEDFTRDSNEGGEKGKAGKGSQMADFIHL
jgi:hypothetical protein